MDIRAQLESALLKYNETALSKNDLVRANAGVRLSIHVRAILDGCFPAQIALEEKALADALAENARAHAAHQAATHIDVPELCRQVEEGTLRIEDWNWAVHEGHIYVMGDGSEQLHRFVRVAGSQSAEQILRALGVKRIIHGVG